MVRLRQRYMLCELTHKSENKFLSCTVSKTEVEQAVRTQLTKLYGIYGAALCREATVKYFHAPTGMIIFRFAPKGQRVFGGTVARTTIGEYHLTIKQVAATCRTVNKKLIQLFRNDIAQAHIIFPKFEDSYSKIKESEAGEQLEQLTSGEGGVTY
ncbi:ribonuclease P/MRP protein subunit POP5-like [Tropilaelaps mercedesae]|uniref:Ribonuclease P/MRP protein subunit POP5-like n=1 Tax=Tropilaelaps mercedesae TaxID=418985 RepID=A0A1V9X1V8_9ACAR|nr:ribonuclease P/MRP protein subunit POP5-like [Tropilaelaps mercedesae]